MRRLHFFKNGPCYLQYFVNRTFTPLSQFARDISYLSPPLVRFARNPSQVPRSQGPGARGPPPTTQKFIRLRRAIINKHRRLWDFCMPHWAVAAACGGNSHFRRNTASGEPDHATDGQARVRTRTAKRCRSTSRTTSPNADANRQTASTLEMLPQQRQAR